MNKKTLKTLLLTGVTFLTLGTGTSHANELENIFKEGNFYADVRYRYEAVEQGGIANDASASTIRTKVGYKTGSFLKFSGLFEIESIGNLGKEDYNNTVNSNATYPVVADPAGTELNQAYLTYKGIPDTSISVGRQDIKLDNQRFVGTVGWRQNSQTFDAVTIKNNSIENLSLQYGYVQNVNRIFSDKHALGDLNSEVHLANASFQATDWLKLTGYGYWFDFEELSNRSSKTYGLSAKGSVPIAEETKFTYHAEWARQDDHGNNTANYDADYFHLSPGLKWKNITVAAGFESLEGDGTNSFQTPLATGHAFNGWADKFLNTPANGLEDIYGKFSYKFDCKHEFTKGLKFDAIYHDFSAEKNGLDYGTEWNLQLTKKFKGPEFTKGVVVGIKYANYDADDLYTDTEKLWLSLQIKF